MGSAVVVRALLLQTVIARIVVQQNVVGSDVVGSAVVARAAVEPLGPSISPLQEVANRAHVSKRDQFWD